MPPEDPGSSVTIWLTPEEQEREPHFLLLAAGAQDWLSLAQHGPRAYFPWPFLMLLGHLLYSDMLRI